MAKRTTNKRTKRSFTGTCPAFVHQGKYYLSERTCRKTGVSEKTISEWITTGNWKKYKRNTIPTREEQLINLQDELVEINEAIKAKPEGARFADSKVANVSDIL